MCGISGLVSGEIFDKSAIFQSIDSIAHRGPDEKGFYQGKNCVLGICRLSIVDVESGRQPSFNEDRTIISVFNGEIYNFNELRSELRALGFTISANGDSALIPFLYEAFGDEFPKKIQGMFAIAVYDLKTSRLILSRDRFGKKPLWYSHRDGNFSFSSELKGLLALGVERNFNVGTITEYLSFGYINAPRSPFKNVFQLPPASTLIARGADVSISEYWNPYDIEPREISFQEACEEAEDLIRKAVKSRLISERPIGVFLSGGIDSTLVTKFTQDMLKEKVKTFGIGFHDSKFDETFFSKSIANVIGTTHRQKIIEPDPLLLIQELSAVLDQPFADSSIIPTYLLCKFAREDVVVSLSGDGGDEAFGGYLRYRAGSLLEKLNPLLFLNPIRQISWNRLGNDRFKKLVRHASPNSPLKRYLQFQSLFQQSDISAVLSRTLNSSFESNDFGELWKRSKSSNSFRRMQEFDLKTYLPGDLMYKVDISSMANGLEVRSPFLDYRVVEFGLSLPTQFKSFRGSNKRILREIAKKYIPSELIDRPKMGFGIPRAQWLRRELKELSHEMLLDSSAISRELFNIKEVENVLEKHQQGQQLDNLIWPLLMLELWAKNWLH